MENKGDLTVLNFIAESNEFIEGKFLFASQKLEALYKRVLDSPALVELFLQCSEDFKYSLEMTKAFIKTPTKPGTFTPPKEPDKFLALVFGMLKEINEKTINFNVFVPKHFSEDVKVPPTQAFANQVIVPLKDTVAKYFELDKDNKKFFSDEDVSEQEIAEDESSDASQTEEETLPVQEESVEKLDENFEKEPQPNQIRMDEQDWQNQPEPVITSPFEQEAKMHKITYEDLIEALTLLLKEMQTLLKSWQKVKPEVKTDAVFVLARALAFASEDDMQGLYSEIVSIKYMRRHLRFMKNQINELFEIFEYFEKL